MNYLDLDKGQVYGDYVILGWKIVSGIEYLLSDSWNLFGYWYLKDKTLLTKSIYPMKKMNMYYYNSYCIAICTDREFSGKIYEVDESFIINNGKIEENKFNRKSRIVVAKEVIDKYVLKKRLLNEIAYEIYSKKDLHNLVYNYIESDKYIQNNEFLLKSIIKKFNKEMGISAADRMRLGYTNNVKEIELNTNIILIRTKKGYGFLDFNILDYLICETDVDYIPPYVDRKSNFGVIKNKIWFYDNLNYKKKLPNIFKVIHNMNDVREVFYNYVTAIIYGKAYMGNLWN